MGRFLTVVILILLASRSAVAAYSDAAAAREAVLSGSSEMSGEDRASALALLKAEAERSPEDTETLRALVMACEMNNDWDTGLPAARTLVELAPDNADHQYLLGNALFSTIDEVSMFNKGARASAGRKAYQTAIELDPTHVDARTGLFFFYMEAPGFAGGSTKKAREIAEEIAGEPENMRTGNELLMALAAKQKDWDRYNELLVETLDAVSEEDRATILLTATYTALFHRKDYEAGLEYSQRYRAAAGEGQGGYSTNYFEGVALHGLGRYAEAVEKFEAVLAVHPVAKNTRWLAAESCEELGRDAEAAAHYAEYAERFPEDDKAKAAKKKVKKLR